MFSASDCRREMVCKQRPNPLDTMHERICEVSVLKARPHCFDYLAPKTLSAFCVNAYVADDRKTMRARSDKNQYVVPQCGAIHLEPLETARRFRKRVSDILVADEHEDLSGCALLGIRDRRENPVAIDSI